MKKVIIIAMLLTVLSVCLLSTGICFADETEKTSSLYYFEKTQATLNLELRMNADGESKILILIPHSYAFEKLEEPANGFVKVRYNSLEGYVQTASFNSNCKPVNDKWGSNPYAYDLSYEITPQQIALYKEDDLSLLKTEPSSNVTVKKVYGYFIKEGNTYFLTEVTVSIPEYDVTSDKRCYVKATDTSLSTFKAEEIPVSAGYTAQTSFDKPDDQIDSGDNVPPVNDDTSPTRNPKNSLDRYIMIAVIAVLCVVIIVLIFIPNRKKS